MVDGAHDDDIESTESEEENVVWMKPAKRGRPKERNGTRQTQKRSRGPSKRRDRCGKVGSDDDYDGMTPRSLIAGIPGDLDWL